MNQKPLNNYIVVKPFPKEKSTFLTQQERPSKGEVISANDNSKLTQGDIVMFSSNTGVPFPVDGEDYLLMRETEIFCVEGGAKKTLLEKLERFVKWIETAGYDKNDKEIFFIPVSQSEINEIKNYIKDGVTAIIDNDLIAYATQLTFRNKTFVLVNTDKEINSYTRRN